MVELFRNVLWINQPYRVQRSQVRKGNKCICKHVYNEYLAKGVSSTTWGDAPTTTIIRIRPQEITHWTFMWDLLNTVKVSYIVKGFNRRGQSTMQTEDFRFNLYKAHELRTYLQQKCSKLGTIFFNKQNYYFQIYITQWASASSKASSKEFQSISTPYEVMERKD